MRSRETTDTNFIDFDFTRPRLESTIYRTGSEHANHYTTDAIHIILNRETSHLNIFFQKDYVTIYISTEHASIQQLHSKLGSC